MVDAETSDVAVIDSVDGARDVLDPLRSRILVALRRPGSATTVAHELGESRQKVNYHVRELEAHGLIGLVEERPRRGLTERVVVANAHAYVLSPAVLGDGAVVPERVDRWSAQYLVAVAARILHEVGDLMTRAAQTSRPLATLTIDTEIRFGSAADRAAFTDELASTVRSMSERFHDETAPGGRWHRVVVAAHPTGTPSGRPDPHHPEEH